MNKTEKQNNENQRFQKQSHAAFCTKEVRNYYRTAKKQPMKPKKLPLWGMLITTALVLGGLYAFHWWTLHKASIYEQRVEEAVARGDWAEAASLGEKAEAAGAADTMDELTYANALALFSNGEYIQAREMFVSLGAYEDAAHRALSCTYKLAEQAEAAGYFAAALEGFLASV